LRHCGSAHAVGKTTAAAGTEQNGRPRHRPSPLAAASHNERRCKPAGVPRGEPKQRHGQPTSLSSVSPRHPSFAAQTRRRR
jgi:hypothetical protein